MTNETKRWLENKIRLVEGRVNDCATKVESSQLDLKNAHYEFEMFKRLWTELTDEDGL